MVDTTVAPRIAFVHLMRTGGTFLCAEIRRALAASHRICDSWFQGFGRDWSADELREFAAAREPTFVHNHVVNWDAELVAAYRRAGFFVFALVRPLGDQLCSLYHFARRRNPEGDLGSLDAYLRAQLRGETIADIDHLHWAVPEWWRELDAWGRLVPARRCAGTPRERRPPPDPEHAAPPFAGQLALAGCAAGREGRNASGSLGFDHYLRRGEISSETADLLKGSVYVRRYRAVVDWIERSQRTVPHSLNGSAP